MCVWICVIAEEGYRTQEEQQELMDEKVEEYQERFVVKFLAKWQAKKWVAIPGTSEHQLGLAVDINADISKRSSQEVYSWLAKNAHEYGFIQRYPANKTEITGISYEPWHYRYVGEDVAKEIYEEGICLEEYIRQKNKSLATTPGDDRIFPHTSETLSGTALNDRSLATATDEQASVNTPETTRSTASNNIISKMKQNGLKNMQNSIDKC